MPYMLPLEGLPGQDGLFALTPKLARQLGGVPHSPVAVVVAPRVPGGGVVRIDLPRWDLEFEAKRRRGGWPVVDPVTRRVVKHRRVWDALRGNSRYGHWYVRHKAVREVVDAVAAAATMAGLVPCRHLTVGLVWAPGDHRRADDDNLWPLAKVCFDALARGPQGKRPIPGLRLVPDDTSRFMAKLAPRIDRPPDGRTGPSGLWLEVVVDSESDKGQKQ